jgi:integrase
MTARTKLAEGEHSISRAKVRTRLDANGRPKDRVLDWRVRPHGFAEPLRRRTEGGTRESDGSIRARALATAAELLRTDGVAAQWTPSSRLGEYVRQVVLPSVERAPVAANTKARYLQSLKQLVGDCAGHTHQASLDVYTIRAGTQFAELEHALVEIAALHGMESARQARTVLTGYVLKDLMRKRLITYNAIRGERLDLATGAKVHEGGKHGGVALSRNQYEAVLEYLLAVDPADGAVRPSRGRWGLDDVIAKRRNAVDLTLLQMATGLRVSEARQAWCGLLVDSSEGMYVDVVAEIAKGGYARRAHVLDDRVVERLRERLSRADSPSELVVGSPYDTDKVWDARNCTKVLESLYEEMAEGLGIEAFQTERSHVWRATLNTLTVGVVPEVHRAAQFGHTTDVNRKSYTDTAMSSDMVAAARRALTAK